MDVRTDLFELRTGELEWLDHSDESSVATFLRRGEGEDLLVTVNLSSRPFTGTVSRGGGFVPLGTQAAPLPELRLDAWAWRLYRAPR